MEALLSKSRKLIACLLLLTFPAACMLPAQASPVIELKKWQGSIDLSAQGPLPFELHGVASHLGRFTADGEVEFAPGPEPGTLAGHGVVVFTAANGDLLAGIVTWDAARESGALRSSALRFAWRDSVQFSDGTVAHSTGRFEKNRPPGLVVIAIIAILIGMLLPAVQKVR